MSRADLLNEVIMLTSPTGRGAHGLLIATGHLRNVYRQVQRAAVAASMSVVAPAQTIQPSGVSSGQAQCRM